MSRIRIPGKLPYLKFPLHYEGAPPRRLFFPDWYIKLVKPNEEMPPNYCRFHIPHDMTKYDFKEYLEKIYNIPVARVTVAPVTWVRYKDGLGKWQFIEPWKIAHVELGEGQTFKFPDLLPKEKDEDQLNTLEAYEKMKELEASESKKPQRSNWKNEWFN